MIILSREKESNFKEIEYSVDKLTKYPDDTDCTGGVFFILRDYMKYMLESTYDNNNSVFMFMDFKKMNVTFFDFYEKGTRMNLVVFDIIECIPVEITRESYDFKEFLNINYSRNSIVYRYELETILNYLLEDVVKEIPPSFLKNGYNIQNIISSESKGVNLKEEINERIKVHCYSCTF